MSDETPPVVDWPRTKLWIQSCGFGGTCAHRITARSEEALDAAARDHVKAVHA